MNTTGQLDHTSYGIISIYHDKDGSKEYLLLQNHGGYWGFPKGHREQGETPKATAVREAKEETALEIDESSLDFSVSYDYGQPIDGVIQTKRVVLFPVTVSVKDVTVQAKEIGAYRWAPYDEAVSLIDLPTISQALKQVESR